MGSRYRQMPPDLIRGQIDITDRLDTLESTPRSVATSVDTGNWKFIAANGAEIIKFGDEGGSIGAGWVFRRSDSTLAFALGGNAGNQFFAFYDHNGNMLLSDDTSQPTAQGLARPYIPYVAQRYTDYLSPLVTTTSGTFTPAYIVAGVKQHPCIFTRYIITTPAGVSAQVQLVDTTTGDPTTQSVIQGPVTYGGNTFQFADVQGSLPNEGHMQEFQVDIQMRVSAGAGTIGISHIFSYGIQA